MKTPLDSLKTMQINEVFTKEHIAKTFPMSLGILLRDMNIQINGGRVNLLYKADKLHKFMSDMEEVILTNKFDYLDNIVLELLDNYTILLGEKLEDIDIPEKDRTIFIDTCNNFKDRTWNDIFDDFLDAVYVVLKDATIAGRDIRFI